jgi:hypothetical protein
MGAGHIIPIEEHLLVKGEGLCSTQVEPSLSQGPQGPIDANQRQSLDPWWCGVDVGIIYV